MAAAHARLVDALAPWIPERLAWLAQARADARATAHPDYLWHGILQSFSTWGGTQGINGLIAKPVMYARAAYERLVALPADERVAELISICRIAKLRWPNKKAEYLARCLARIEAMGGPSTATAALLAQPGRAGKLKFLGQFPGISAKYGRNLLMDVDHPDFRDSIAVDGRIKDLSSALRLRFVSYEAHEQFYLDVAHTLSVDGWSLDRLLYHHQPIVLARLTGSG